MLINLVNSDFLGRVGTQMIARDAWGSERCRGRVWTGRKLSAARLDIDHCLPWAAWLCEDLWNLLPSSPAVNRHGKRDRLPSPELLERSEDRILSWWERAWVSNPGTAGRFTAEAQASLPVPAGRDDLGAVFTGLQARRFAIRADQQVAEWSPA
jgi:hypothetical protein